MQKKIIFISENIFWIWSVLVGQSDFQQTKTFFLIARPEKKPDMLKNWKYINKTNIDSYMLGNF